VSALDRLEIRTLTSASELAALPVFEAEIWGAGGDCVSVNMLVACISEGGVAIGAFDGARLVGTVFGFPTREPHVLHSHYMAVHPEYRRHGLGVTLKHSQRQWCLEQGITVMRWTYDPLQLANAHLNLRALGARGVSYHIDHYGHLGGINGSLPSDRVTVSWDLVDPAPQASTTSGAHVVIDVPPATPDDIASSNDAALHARLAVRAGLAERMSSGWQLVDVDRDARQYTLGRV
jgi:predicted GNAT superfamily acetyltransferase